MDRMTADEFVPLAPSHGKVRVNHTSDSCSGGRDSMVVERKEDGSIHAYCFRCGARGYAGADGYRKSATELREKFGGVRSDVGRGPVRSKPESGGVKGYGGFPAHVRAWLSGAGLSPAAVDAHDCEYFDREDALYIGVLQVDRMIGWVRRSFNPKDYRPVPLVSMDRFYGHWWTPEAGTVVLTEDVLSAYRCFVDSKHDSISLMGTEIRDTIVDTILLHRYHTAIVFLDGDNPTVRMKARKIAKRLPFLSTRIIEDGRDPKRHSKEELTCLLT